MVLQPPTPLTAEAEQQRRSQDRARTGDFSKGNKQAEEYKKRKAVSSTRSPSPPPQPRAPPSTASTTPLSPPRPRVPRTPKSLPRKSREAPADQGRPNTDQQNRLEQQVSEAAREAQAGVDLVEYASNLAKKAKQKKADEAANRPSQLAKAAIIDSMSVAPNLREGSSGSKRPPSVSIQELFASPAKALTKASPQRHHD